MYNLRTIQDKMVRGFPDMPKINENSPQSKGLVFWVPVGAGNKGAAFDIVNKLILPGVGGSVVGHQFGPAWDIGAAAATVGARANAPGQIQNLLPMSMVCVFFQQKAPDANGQYFEVSFQSTDAGAFVQYAIANNGGPNFAFEYNNAGVFTTLTAAAGALANNGFYVAVATLDTQGANLYVNGVLQAGQGGVTSVTNGAGAIVGVGVHTSDAARNSGAYIYDCRIYNRVLTKDEINGLTGAGWIDLYK